MWQGSDSRTVLRNGDKYRLHSLITPCASVCPQARVRHPTTVPPPPSQKSPSGWTTPRPKTPYLIWDMHSWYPSTAYHKLNMAAGRWLRAAAGGYLHGNSTRSGRKITRYHRPERNLAGVFDEKFTGEWEVAYVQGCRCDGNPAAVQCCQQRQLRRPYSTGLLRELSVSVLLWVGGWIIPSCRDGFKSF